MARRLTRRKKRPPAPPEATPAASDNPFVLPGLPAFPGLKGPGAGKAKRGRKRRRRPFREYEEPWDSEKFADQWNHSTPPPVLPPADGAAVWAGAWDDWVSDPAHRAPESDASEDDTLDDDEIDRDDDPAWDVPEYDGATDYIDNGTAARAAFRDRSGGRGILRAATERNAGGGRSTTVRVVAVLVVWAVVVAVVALILTANGQERPPTAAPPVTSAPSAPATSTAASPWGHATLGCTKTRTPGAAVGAEPGSTASAVDAIFGFEWAYYVDRSATKARTYTTPDAAIPPSETIQQGIDQQPKGTRYCVYLTQADKDGNLWNIELHEQWPGDSQPQKYTQTITTARLGNRTLITAITAK
ncbi:hypothetical protein ACFVMC_16710 [Nocardia sp. NPDC127579]|uniref:hypothetical protein n=1 Tax=Nocardia sp. NPDC127579 TaxID=3345402 RepID=UPI0036373692